MVLLQALFKNSDLLGKQVLLQVMNRTNPTPGSQDGVPEVRGAPVTSTHLGTKYHPIDCDPWLRSFEIGPWPQTPWPHDLPQHASVCKMMGWRPRSPTLKYHSQGLHFARFEPFYWCSVTGSSMAFGRCFERLMPRYRSGSIGLLDDSIIVIVSGAGLGMMADSEAPAGEAPAAIEDPEPIPVESSAMDVPPADLPESEGEQEQEESEDSKAVD